MPTNGYFHWSTGNFEAIPFSDDRRFGNLRQLESNIITTQNEYGPNTLYLAVRNGAELLSIHPFQVETACPSGRPLAVNPFFHPLPFGGAEVRSEQWYEHLLKLYNFPEPCFFTYNCITIRGEYGALHMVLQ